MKDLKENIKALMLEKDWNQSELAMRSGLEQATVSRILSGKTTNPHSFTLMKMTQALETTTERIMGELPVPDDWRNHTCGECGYFWYTTTDTEKEILLLDECDCMKWKHGAMPHHKCCPDLVLREPE